MIKKMFFLMSVITSCLFVSVLTNAQTLGQTDTFQDGTVNSWISGAPNPTPPLNISTNGPQGSGDKYLRAISSGSGTAGSKLVIRNTKQWAGNYISAGIGNIHLFLKNEGATELQIRIALISTTGSCSSVNAVTVPVGSGWIQVNFPITASALTGGTVSSILTGVTELRILHRSTPGTAGDPVNAQLGIDNITATSLPTTVDAAPSESPRVFTLSQNYPNPFNPATTINYELPDNSVVTLKVYNVLGKEVATLVNGEMNGRGMHSVQFNASGLSSGVYFYRLESGNGAQVKQLVVMK